MRKIEDTLSYKGGHISQNHLYTKLDEPLIVTGTVHFVCFGDVYMNGVKLVNAEMRINFVRNVEFKLSKGSGILFYEAPRLVKELEEPIPLPHPPEMEDDMTRQMRMLFDSWVKERGLVPDSIGFDDDDDMEDIDEFDELVLDDTGFEDEDNIIPLISNDDTDGNPDDETVKAETDGDFPAEQEVTDGQEEKAQG